MYILSYLRWDNVDGSVLNGSMLEFWSTAGTFIGKYLKKQLKFINFYCLFYFPAL